MLDANAGVQAFVFAPPALPGSGGGLPIQYVLRTIGDPAQVFEIAEADQGARRSVRQVHRGPELDGLSMTPQARVTVDRDRAAALGVPVSEIGTTLSALVGGAPISQVRPRQPQLRHHHAGPAGDPRTIPSGSAQYFVRARRTARWCRCRRW